MAEKLGENYVLRIGNGASPEVFNEIAGQQSLSLNAPNSLIPTSHKGTGRFGTNAAGRADVTIDCAGILTLPDASGFEALKTAHAADPQAAVTFEIYDAVAAAAVYRASCWIGNLSYGMNDQEAATYAFSLSLAAAPTLNDFTP